MELIEGKEISVNVISKSGTTTEPAIAFRIFKDYMEKNTVKMMLRTVFTLLLTRLGSA